MASLNHQVFVVSVFLFVVIDIVSSLQCYYCSSRREDICDDNFSHLAYQTVAMQSCEHSRILPIPGAGPNTHCGKTKNINTNSPTDYVFRGCVPENYCKLVKESVSECELCEEERCNSASSVVPSIVLATVAGLISLRIVLNL